CAHWRQHTGGECSSAHPQGGRKFHDDAVDHSSAEVSTTEKHHSHPSDREVMEPIAQCCSLKEASSLKREHPGDRSVGTVFAEATRALSEGFLSQKRSAPATHSRRKREAGRRKAGSLEALRRACAAVGRDPVSLRVTEEGCSRSRRVPIAWTTRAHSPCGVSPDRAGASRQAATAARPTRSCAASRSGGRSASAGSSSSCTTAARPRPCASSLARSYPRSHVRHDLAREALEQVGHVVHAGHDELGGLPLALTAAQLRDAVLGGPHQEERRCPERLRRHAEHAREV